MKISIIRILAFLTLTLNWLHAAPLERLPIKDLEEVVANMADRTASVSAGIWIESQTGSYQKTYYNTRDVGVGLIGVRDAIAGISFELQAINNKDKLRSWVSVRDQNDHLLFYGNKSTPLVPSGKDNVFFVSGNMSLNFSYEPEIVVPGAEWATAYTIDPKTGETDKIIDLDVDEDGTISIPEALIGKIRIEVEYDTGETVVYNTDGSVYNPSKVYATLSIGFQNAVMLTDSDVEINGIESYSGYGDNQLVHLRLTKPKVVVFSAKTTEGANAIGLKFRLAGPGHTDDPWAPAVFQQPDQGGEMFLESGDWYIIFEWDQKQFRPWLKTYNPPDNGGGEG